MEIIISNAFFAKQGAAQNYLEFNALRKFCNIAYEKIISNQNADCKYVCFEAEEEDLDDFCDADTRYVRGIDKVFRVGEIANSELERLNSIYTVEVQESLEAARIAFAELEV